MISIIIAANNEEAVIADTLKRLLNGANAGELEVLIVCNGCADRTVEECEQFGHPVQVITTDVANKALALELGDREASGFPRLYVDADVAMGIGDVRKVARALSRRQEPFAAAPRLRVEVDDRSWIIRSYFDVWQRLPYARHNLVGAGVYAVNRAGWERMGPFPKQGCDDLWVSGHFAEEERISVIDAEFVVPAPHTVKELVLSRARMRANRIFERSSLMSLKSRAGSGVAGSLQLAATDPSALPGLFVYGVITLAAVIRARYKVLFNRRRWERDSRIRPSSHPNPQLDRYEP